MKKDGKNKTTGWFFMIGLAAMAAMGIFLFVQGNSKEEGTTELPPAPPGTAQTAQAATPTNGTVQAGLIETNPVLPATQFTGKVANTYKIAAEIPGAIDGLYCYCKCKENPMFRHKTLLTCFTNNHAADCDICMHEAEMAWDLTKQGKSPKEIRIAVDAYYAKQPIL